MNQPQREPPEQDSRWQWRIVLPLAVTLVLDLRLWLLLLALVGIALRLALWQHDRGAEKLAQQDLLVARMAAAPLSCGALGSRGADVGYLRIQLTGYFDADRTLLLDNRTRGGIAGYQVVTPFRCTDWAGRWLLVDRGWLPVGRDRSVLPAPVTPGGEQRLSAFVYVPEGPGVVFASELADGWPKVVNHLDVPTLARLFDAPVYPHRLVLEPAEVQRSGGTALYNHDTTRIDADKHFGYMVQWCGIGLGIFAYGLFVSWRRGRAIEPR